jgi:cation:H+ antiporter
MDLVAQPLWVALAAFGLAAAVIAAAGTLMAQVADRLADRTGLGEAITGGVLLGASTSLSGFITSVSTAAQGFADLALSNAVGGIAVQTAFLAVADIYYRRANLEHAAASITNLAQGALLIGLLSLPLLAGQMPAWTILGCHPASFIILIAYVFGMRIASETHREPLWDRPRPPRRGAIGPKNRRAVAVACSSCCCASPCCWLSSASPAMGWDRPASPSRKRRACRRPWSAPC